MKYLVALAFLVTGSLHLNAQRIPSLTPKDEAGVEQVSLANPYVGAVKLVYNFDDEQPLNDNFLFTANVQLTFIQTQRFALPVVGIAGLSSTDLLNPGSGLNLGLFPWYVLDDGDNLDIILHGGLNYKTITKDVEAGAAPPQQFKALAGIELIYGKEGKLPSTLSITPAYLYHFDEQTDDTFALELTAIVPVAPKLAVMAESIMAFNDFFGSQFRFAVITTFE